MQQFVQVWLVMHRLSWSHISKRVLFYYQNKLKRINPTWYLFGYSSRAFKSDFLWKSFVRKASSGQPIEIIFESCRCVQTILGIMPHIGVYKGYNRGPTSHCTYSKHVLTKMKWDIWCWYIQCNLRNSSHLWPDDQGYYKSNFKWPDLLMNHCLFLSRSLLFVL